MNLRALKILIAVMSVLLVAGIAGKLSHRRPPPALPEAAVTAPAITLPHGASIERMSTGPDRIVLEVLLADGSAQLVEIDLATGRLVGIVPLKEAP